MTTVSIVGAAVVAWGFAANGLRRVFQRLDRGARWIRIEDLEADVRAEGLAFTDWPLSRFDWRRRPYRRYVLPLYRTLNLPS